MTHANSRVPKRSLLPHLLFVIFAIIGGCAGDSPNLESGAECWDGKDNDGDELIDCKDSDCNYLEICGQQPDQGVDKEEDPPPDKGTPDTKPPPDQAPPPDVAPDTGPTSMYGRRCLYTGTHAELCEDGETYCVPTQLSSSEAVCTSKCPTFGQRDGCPAEEGQQASCFLEFDGQPYCLFLCGRGNDCPDELTCSGQGTCR